MPRQPKRISKKQKRTNGFYFWGFATIIIIVALVQVTSNISSSANALGGIDIPVTAATTGEIWWNPEYSSRKKLDTTNKTDTTLKYVFDHKALVDSNLSIPDASDIKLIAQVQDISDEVAFDIQRVNRDNTTIVFDISKYPTASYFIYFGNSLPLPSKVLGTFKLDPNSAELITAGEIEHPNLLIGTQKTWNLTSDEITEVALNYRSASAVERSHIYYVLDEKAKLIDTDLTSLGTEGELKLKLDKKVTAGYHSLFLVIDTDQGLIRSNSVNVVVSAPLYVAMTIDWEGRGGEQDWVLQEFTNIANEYGVKFTHFFNPRVFISQFVPEYQANLITSWVKARHEVYGDEVALHLHMFYDMVEAAGVEPIKAPGWGTGIDGYDVLTSGYSYQDITKMLTWSLKEFEKAGLPRPKGFRAGGWFANMDTLRAVNDAGFEYDSSGREQYTFGSLEAKGNWNLLHTTQPYFPSQTDQNLVGTDIRLNLLEIPNNGNDSYWFNEQQLIDRFYMNYNPGEILNNPVMVTYLSHPDWYFTDKPRIERLLQEIDQYTWQNDSGPVVFTTIEDTLPVWN